MKARLRLATLMVVRSRPSFLLFIIIVSFPTLPGVVFATEYNGKVVGVTDGDTITVLHGGVGERIRLNGIDCPEKGQAFGGAAKQATSQLAFGKHVTVQTDGLDKFGRTIADVILPDGVNLNQELVRKGWCWWYRKYAPGNVTMEKLEADARAARAGLWRDQNPIPPWVFRKLRRGSTSDPSDMPLRQLGAFGIEPGTRTSLPVPPLRAYNVVMHLASPEVAYAHGPASDCSDASQSTAP